MFSVDLSTSESGGHVVVALRGELDIAGAVRNGGQAADE